MFIKLNNNEIEKYPYNINDLKQDNPDTSFPSEVPLSIFAEYDVYEVKTTVAPAITMFQTLLEGTPELVNDDWVQTWIVSDKPLEEKESLKKLLRSEAYKEESDPIFFKWQRGEATEQEWLDKVAEIKQRWS
jgi:hypothetical protein